MMRSGKNEKFDWWFVVVFGVLCLIGIGGEDLYAWVKGLEVLGF